MHDLIRTIPFNIYYAFMRCEILRFPRNTSNILARNPRNTSPELDLYVKEKHFYKFALCLLVCLHVGHDFTCIDMFVFIFNFYLYPLCHAFLR